MKFQVPQFIEVEDKIFGPLTFKQFLYLLGGGGGGFLLFAILPTFIGLPLAVLWAGLGVALAFYKINNRPFILFLEAAFRYMMEKKLYIWKREQKKVTAEQEEGPGARESVDVSRLSEGKLKNLGWNLQVSSSDKIPNNRENNAS